MIPALCRKRRKDNAVKCMYDGDASIVCCTSSTVILVGAPLPAASYCCSICTCAAGVLVPCECVWLNLHVTNVPVGQRQATALFFTFNKMIAQGGMLTILFKRGALIVWRINNLGQPNVTQAASVRIFHVLIQWQGITASVETSMSVPLVVW